MEAKFSKRVKDVITFSREEALRLGHDYIGIEHLMLGMIRDGEGVGIKLLKSLRSDLIVQVDGGVNAETARACIQAGADVLVAGSYIFKAVDKKAAIDSLKN